MITEDYVSFEVAKLLKEKGFNEKCVAYYPQCITPIKLTFGGRVNYNSSNKFKMLPPISAPTHQMAMKWLMEAHNIMVSPYALSLGYYFEIFDLSTRDITGCKPLYQVGVPSKEYVLSTYEEAVEVGIKYVLENLL